MKKEHTFTCKYGKLVTHRVDMDDIRAEVSAWEASNPKPEAPGKPPPYYRENARDMLAIKKELGLSRGDAIKEWQSRQEQVPDIDDPEYKRKYSVWLRMKFNVMASLVVSRGVFGHELSESELDVMDKVRVDGEAFRSLYGHIINTSELNESVVLAAVESFGYTWKDKPILWWVNNNYLPKGDVGSSWIASGCMAARHVENMGPHRYKQLEVAAQAEILAIYLIESWMKALRAEEERQKREANRNRNTTNYGR